MSDSPDRIGSRCECILCVDYGNRDTYGRGDIGMLDTVRQHGFQVTGIGPTEQDDTIPYSFTVGMWHSHRQPELAIYGVGDVVVMMEVLNKLVRAAVAAGRLLRPGEEFTELLGLREVPPQDYRLRLMPIHPSWYPSQFGTATFFNAANRVQFLQVLWADGQGRYPGERGFDDNFADRQPLMWLPIDDHPPGVWVDLASRDLYRAGRPCSRETNHMGAWSSGAFDNDSAADWANGFDDTAPEQRRGFLEATFAKAHTGGYLEVDDCSAVIAAATVVVAVQEEEPDLGSYGPKNLEELPQVAVDDGLRATAIAALHEVIKPDTEWSGLWNDAGMADVVFDGAQRLISMLTPYTDWSKHRGLEDAAASHLRDPSMALEMLRGVVDLDAVQGFTMTRFVKAYDWGLGLYQQVMLTDGQRLIVWMGDDRSDADRPGAVLFKSEIRMIPLSWIYDVSLEANYRRGGVEMVVHDAELRVFVGAADYAFKQSKKRTDLYSQQLRETKSSEDGEGQVLRLIEFGRLLASLVR